VSRTEAASISAFASVLHAKVASPLILHNMTVFVVYDRHLLQISNELEEVLLEFRLIHLLFALDQSLESGRLDY
jgi:hypothetical protein